MQRHLIPQLPPGAKIWAHDLGYFVSWCGSIALDDKSTRYTLGLRTPQEVARWAWTEATR